MIKLTEKVLDELTLYSDGQENKGILQEHNALGLVANFIELTEMTFDSLTELNDFFAHGEYVGILVENLES